MHFSKPLPRLVYACSIALVLTTGCSKSEEKKPTTQVVARVNGTEITVHQVNFALSRAGNIPPDQVKNASHQVLEKLVDQQVLVQKAVEKKLDRDPRVIQAIDAAKQQILSQAFLEQEASAVPKSSAQDVASFYGKHPELFEKRRIYRYQQIAIQPNAELLPKLQDEITKAKTLNDVAVWLKTQNVQFGSAEVATRAAEQLPLEWMPTLQKMSNGSIALINQQNMLLITQLLASQEAPLDEKKAAPYIEQFLHKQKEMEFVSNEIKQFRTQAKIEYMGDFAQPKEAAKNVSQAAPTTAPETPEKKSVAADETVKKQNDAFMEKGLSGLK